MKRTSGGGSAGRVPRRPSSNVASADPGPGEALETSNGAGSLAVGGAELLEDRSIRLGSPADHDSRRGPRQNGRSRRAGMSLSGALAGSFLVAALAFGAAAGPLGLTGGGHGPDGARAGAGAAEPTDTTTSDNGNTAKDDTAHGDGTGSDRMPDGSTATGGTGSDLPAATAAPVDGGGNDATPEPAQTEAPAEPAPQPAPKPAAIEIGVGIDSVYPAVEWSRCSVDGFVAYKVIRSTNEGAAWPLGSGDTLVGVLKEATAGRFVDRGTKRGTTYHYRVAAFRTWNAETVVACLSGVKGVTTPAPDPTTNPIVGPELTVSLNDGGHPVVDWTACSGADFSYYKVVRSKDATVTWPIGENDSLIAVVGPDGGTITTDTAAPAGITVYYRVFCVRATDAGYVVVAASDVRAIETAPAPPSPDPVNLGMQVTVGGEGVALTWQQCTSDAFHWYKVVRSTTTTNPSYLPATDGTELIGVIENAATNHFVDATPPAGHTAYYRVQCLGYWYGKVVLLGQTAVSVVAIP